jgi:hypothetical protein
MNKYEILEAGTTMTAQAANAIARSVSHSEIVHISGADEDTIADLQIASEGDAVHKVDGVHSYEFWGTTESGDEWRVHCSEQV